MNHKHCVFCGEEIPNPYPSNWDSVCKSPANTLEPDTVGNRHHAFLSPANLEEEFAQVQKMLKENDLEGLAAYANKNNRERAKKRVQALTEQRERGGGSAKEWLKANRKTFVHGRERYSWTAGESYREELLDEAEMLEAYASSCLAQQQGGIVKNKSTEALRAFWEHVESVAASCPTPFTEKEYRWVEKCKHVSIDSGKAAVHCNQCKSVVYESAASSCLAEVSAQLETLEEQKSNLLGALRNAHHDVATLRAEVERLTKQLIIVWECNECKWFANPQNEGEKCRCGGTCVQTVYAKASEYQIVKQSNEISRLEGVVAGLKGERDALHQAIVKACVEMKDAYDDGELSIWCQSIWKELEATLLAIKDHAHLETTEMAMLRKSADASHLAASTECSRANKAEAALSQAQQALRWVSVNERMPNSLRTVIVAYHEEGQPDQADAAYWDGTRWMESAHSELDEVQVYAWREVPLPPEAALPSDAPEAAKENKTCD